MPNRAALIAPLLMLVLAGCSAAPEAPAGSAVSSSTGPTENVLVFPAAVPEELVSTLHFLDAPRIQTQVPTGAEEKTTLIPGDIGNPLAPVTSHWVYQVQRAGVFSTGDMLLHFRATRQIALLAKTATSDSCSFVVLMVVTKADGSDSTYNSVACKDGAAGVVAPGDFDVQLPLAWHGSGGAPMTVDIGAGDTIDLQVGVNYVDPAGDSLLLVAGTPAMDSVATLPDLHEPVSSLTDILFSA